MLIQITALKAKKPFCAAYDTEGGIAPIIRYMQGWTLRHIMVYCARLGWKVEIVEK